MTRRTNNTPSKTLAKVHEANQVPAPYEPPVTFSEGASDLELHAHIVAKLDPGSLVGAALIELMDTRKMSGTVRLEKIKRAITMLIVEARKIDPQFVATAVAMCVALPAWLGVMARCGGLV